MAVPGGRSGWRGAMAGDLETGPSRERAGGDLAAGPDPDLGVAARHVQSEEAREPGTDKLTSAQPGYAQLIVWVAQYRVTTVSRKSQENVASMSPPESAQPRHFSSTQAARPAGESLRP